MGELVAPQLERRGLRVVEVGGCRQALPLVGCPEPGVIAGLGQCGVEELGLEGPDPRVPEAAFAHDAHAEPGLLGDGEGLDVPAEDLDVGLPRPDDVGLDLLVGFGATGDGARDGERLDVRHSPCRRR